jgi:hypothetical protein
MIFGIIPMLSRGRKKGLLVSLAEEEISCSWDLEEDEPL